MREINDQSKIISNHPKSWIQARLGEIIELEYGKSLTKHLRNEEGEFPVYGSSGVVGHHDDFLVNGPCLVVGRKGGVGEVWLSKNKCWPIDTTYFTKVNNDCLSISFLFFLLKSLRLGQYDKSTAIPGLNRNDAYNIPIGLPPLAEQHRIVDKIEELFSDLDDGIASLKKAQQQLKVYRQAVLKWAFEGKLTAQWREEQKRQGKLESAEILLEQIKAEREQRYQTELAQWQADVKTWEAHGKVGKKPGKPGKHEFYPSLNEEEIDELGKLPPDWRWEKAGNICQSIVPNRDKPKSFSGSIPWLTTPDIDPDKISVNLAQHKIGLTKEEVSEYNARLIPKGSVIMTCVGTFGVICINSVDCVINQQLHAFTIHPYIFAKYLAFALKRQAYWMEDHATATTVSYLNKTNCNSVPIPVCSLAEQLQIVSEIESRLSICDSLEATIADNLQRAEALRQSILKQAFEGKLVPQDPNDEPASVLLERIRISKAAQAEDNKHTKRKQSL